MFKKIALAASVLGAVLVFQSPASADVKFGIYATKEIGHGKHHGNVHKHKHHFNGGQGFKKRGRGYGHYRLTNRELRSHLRDRGLYKIRFIDRHRGVAKVIAHNERGFIAKYAVSTRNGRILNSRFIKPIRGHNRPRHSRVSFQFN